MTTSGSGPASATAALMAAGSLATRVTASRSPEAFNRTITDRRRCRYALAPVRGLSA